MSHLHGPSPTIAQQIAAASLARVAAGTAQGVPDTVLRRPDGQTTEVAGQAGAVRPRDDPSATEQRIAELEAELELRTAQAQIAARKGLLDATAALNLVPEKDIAFSYRSSIKTQHAMRFLGEDDNGFQRVDKCLACGRSWKEILQRGAEDPWEFFHCIARENWDKGRQGNYKKKQQ